MRRVVFAVPGDPATPTGGYGYDRRIGAELARHGWTVAPLPLSPAFPFPTDDDLAAADAALASQRDGEIVVVDGLAFGAMPEAAARHRARLRLVALVHHPLAREAGLAPDAAARLEASERAALAAARLVVTTSRFTRESLVAGFDVDPARIVVVPPGTDAAPRAPRLGNPPLVLSVGSLTPRKGHDVLIDALARICDLPWRARIVGGGTPAAAAGLQSRIDAAGLGPRVRLAGTVPDGGPEMLGADLFVLASRFEGYGMAYAEAMAHGLPVVGCRAGAIPEVVTDGAGILVPPDEPAGLADAMAALLTDRAHTDGLAEAALKRARALPTWAGSAARLAAALERL